MLYRGFLAQVPAVGALNTTSECLFGKHCVTLYEKGLF